MSVGGPPASGSMPQAQSPSLVGQILDGRYRILRKLGEGGMGEVYAAEHVHIEKRFAIKLLRPEIVSNPEAVTRFRQEARSASSIGHRNIIAIEDFGQLADGRIYMCMELLDGAPLNERIAQPIGVDRLLNILIQTGHGLAAAHVKGIVHRDMKPENIFVTIGPSGEDVPKLLDFGIAKVSGNEGENHLTRTGTIFGTPFYMAPEQALGNPVDARTDIYAVGVIMYECFAGSLPFQGDSFMGILTQHITMEPEPVAQRAARAGRQLLPGLADVVARCMQKDPAQRFQTMDELVGALVQIYRGVVGPGMSTYMEAFPVMPTAAYHNQPTPAPVTGPVSGPMTGAVPIAHATAPTIAAIGPDGSAPILPVPGPGLYPGGAAPKRKLGLGFAVLAVLVVGAGVAALVVSQKSSSGPSGQGSGSQGVEHPGHGSGSGSQGVEHPGHGSGSGSQGVEHPGHGSSVVPGGADPDAAVAIPHDAEAGSGSILAGTDPGSGSDPAVPGTGSDGEGSDGEGPDGEVAGGSGQGSNAPPPPEVVQIPLFARNGVAFQVYENGSKLFDGPDNLPVPRGGIRTVVIKARGFKDKTLVVNTTKKKVQFSLSRIPVVNAGSGAGSTVVTPPPGPDCSSKILDPRSKACVAQYCAAHPDEDKCQLQ